MHQRLLHFAVDSKWSDRDVRRQVARYALEAMTRQASVEAWIVDDTGFLKQGKPSVGIQQQHTGSAGKVATCQLGVSLSVATRTEHLPECWGQRRGASPRGPHPRRGWLQDEAPTGAAND
ncbi:transposase [Myxococcus stipitatus]